MSVISLSFLPRLKLIKPSLATSVSFILLRLAKGCSIGTAKKISSVIKGILSISFNFTGEDDMHKSKSGRVIEFEKC
nr:hypothetical protein [Clostridium carboxidivorans]